MAGAASPRQQGKLRKKLSRKEKEHEEADESGRQTRRKRFINPDKPFGKNSLVYQLQYGALKDEVPIESLKQPVRPRPKPSQAYASRDSDNNLCTDKVQRQLFGAVERSRTERPQQWQQDVERPASSRPRESRERRSAGDRDSADLAANAPRKLMPMAIKYTTAASQFLYGRSVVKAALEQSRRKLYNLYVYGGENRADSFYNASMIRLAKSQGVPVTIVPNDEQRLMDKMSMGRPHNGFVLETSPVPQTPVTALGKTEDSPDRFGFHIELAHQTREEESVNGTGSFITRQRGRAMPLVLLLHEILDPGNLGALLRTASYLGVDAVGITSRSSSNLTPVVLKSAAGAVEEMNIFSVDSPVDFIERSQRAGWAAYAAVAPPESKLVRMHQDKFVSTDDVEGRSPLINSPCILVLGNEGHGLPRPIKVAADFEVSIPRVVPDSCIDSLNVSVAGALLCHAFVKGVGRSEGKPTEVVNPLEEAKAEEEVHAKEEGQSEKLF